MGRSLQMVIALCTLIASQSCRAETVDPAKICPQAVTQSGDNDSRIDSTQVCTILIVARNTIERLKGKLTDPGIPPLMSVTMNLKTATEMKKGGGLNLIILKIGKETSAETSQTLNINFVPKEQVAPTAALPSVSKTLADSIVASFNAIKSSGLDMKTGSLSMSVQFGVQQDTSGGIDTSAVPITIVPISINFHGGVDSSNIQELVLQFGNPSPGPGPGQSNVNQR